MKVLKSPKKLTQNQKGNKNKHTHKYVENSMDDQDGPYTDYSESSLKKLIVKPQVKWYEQIPADPKPSAPSPPADLVTKIRLEAEKLHKEDIDRYKKFLDKRREKSDFTWMRTILRSGTLSDKISAHTLLIQDSPVHNLSSIESLLNMVNLKGKRECLMAMDSLKELFLSDLLVPEKKLRSFPQHPISRLDQLTSGNTSSRNKRLILWRFEEELKNLYGKFLKNLEGVSRDNIEKTKQKSVTVMFELLKDNPEQEQFLLEYLVNKIGDPIAKVGSHVCHLLGLLVSHHPTMIAVIVKEVERVLFRPNVAERAKYYCLCFLNQLILSHEQDNIANHLVTMYFGQFKLSLKKGEVNTKMMSALLSGVARAYPYTKLRNDVIMEQLDAMFRLVHIVSFNVSVQALMLIFQVLDSKHSVSDRFYMTLYRKILDPALSSSSRQSMFLNLTYRALKKDAAQVRVKAFVKRLLQISVYQEPNFQCGILMLISELSKSHPNLLEFKQLVAYSDSDSDEHFEDVDEDTQSDVPADKKIASSWIHRINKKSSGYDPHNRNPQHAGAEYSQLWELRLLKKSYHPSISLFAHQVSNMQHINYSGDPLADFTLIRFLDRFVYRNPKKTPESAKANIQRKVFGRKLLSKNETLPIDVTSKAYLQQQESKVPVHEQFIYKYLKQRSQSGVKRKKGDSDVESVGSDEFEELMDNLHPEDKDLDFETQMAGDVSEDFDEDDEDDLLLSDEDDLVWSDEDLLESVAVEKKEQNKKSTKRKSAKEQPEDLFAAADEFGSMLEDNADLGSSALSADALVNADNSHIKQLAWERNRDQFIRGADWKSRKRRKFYK